MAKQFPEAFEDKEIMQSEILEISEKLALADEEEYIKETCSKYEMPCIEFKINAPDYE